LGRDGVMIVTFAPAPPSAADMRPTDEAKTADDEHRLIAVAHCLTATQRQWRCASDSSRVIDSMANPRPRRSSMSVSSAYWPPAVSFVRSHRRSGAGAHGSTARPNDRAAVLGIDVDPDAPS